MRDLHYFFFFFAFIQQKHESILIIKSFSLFRSSGKTCKNSLLGILPAKREWELIEFKYIFKLAKFSGSYSFTEFMSV